MVNLSTSESLSANGSFSKTETPVAPRGQGRSWGRTARENDALQGDLRDEKPDDGTVSMDPGTVVGYFSQDVGDMSGRTALEEVMAGAGRVYELGLEISDLEHRMSDAKGPGLARLKWTATAGSRWSSSTGAATSWRPARRQF